jgi:hypothetical protein
MSPTPDTYSIRAIFFGCCASAIETVSRKTVSSKEIRTRLIIGLLPLLLITDYYSWPLPCTAMGMPQKRSL